MVLKKDITEERLLAGDVGTVVHVYPDGQAYEVEFVSLTGATIAVATVVAELLRSATESDVYHTRPLVTV